MLPLILSCLAAVSLAFAKDAKEMRSILHSDFTALSFAPDSSWSHDTTTMLNTTQSLSDAYNASYTFSFSGRYFVIYGLPSDDRGRFDVYDGEKKLGSAKDAYRKDGLKLTGIPQPTYISQKLKNKEHNIRILQAKPSKKVPTPVLQLAYISMDDSIPRDNRNWDIRHEFGSALFLGYCCFNIVLWTLQCCHVCRARPAQSSGSHRTSSRLSRSGSACSEESSVSRAEQGLPVASVAQCTGAVTIAVPSQPLAVDASLDYISTLPKTSSQVGPHEAIDAEKAGIVKEDGLKE